MIAFLLRLKSVIKIKSCFVYFNHSFFVLCAIFIFQRENKTTEECPVYAVYTYAINLKWSAMKLYRKLRLQFEKKKTKYNQLRWQQ